MCEADEGGAVGAGAEGGVAAGDDLDFQLVDGAGIKWQPGGWGGDKGVKGGGGWGSRGGQEMWARGAGHTYTRKSTCTCTRKKAHAHAQLHTVHAHAPAVLVHTQPFAASPRTCSSSSRTAHSPGSTGHCCSHKAGHATPEPSQGGRAGGNNGRGPRGQKCRANVGGGQATPPPEKVAREEAAGTARQNDTTHFEN